MKSVEDDFVIARQLLQPIADNATAIALMLGEQIVRWAKTYDHRAAIAFTTELARLCAGSPQSYPPRVPTNPDVMYSLHRVAYKAAATIEENLRLQKTLIDERITDMYSDQENITDWWNTPLSSENKYTPQELWDSGNYIAVIDGVQLEHTVWRSQQIISNSSKK